MKFDQIKKLPTELVLMHYFASVDKTDLLTLDDYYKYFELLINDKANLPEKEYIINQWNKLQNSTKSTKRISDVKHNIPLTESVHDEALLFFESRLHDYKEKFHSSLELEDWSCTNDFTYGYPKKINKKETNEVDYTFIAVRGSVMCLFRDQAPEALYIYNRDNKKVNEIFARVEAAQISNVDERNNN